MPEYELLWRNKWLTSEARSINDMISSLREAANQLDQMKTAGVQLREESPVEDDCALLITTDPEVANRFGMTIQ